MIKPKPPTIVYIPKVFLFLTATNRRKNIKVYPIPWVVNWNDKVNELKKSL